MMGGKINVESRFGQGSIFMVNIPQKISKISAPMTEKEIMDTASNLFGRKENNLQEETNISFEKYKGKKYLL